MPITSVQLYTIVDCMTGQRLGNYQAKSPRGAILKFRKAPTSYAYPHVSYAYPHVIAVLANQLTQTPRLHERLARLNAQD